MSNTPTTTCARTLAPPLVDDPRGDSSLLASWRRHPELPWFALFLLVLNAPLFLVDRQSVLTLSRTLGFFPSAVDEGQWWRWLTHPFVHVSATHFVYDALGTLLVYAALEARSQTRRLAYFAASAAGSVLLALALSPHLETAGLSGLSGVAHGLMAVAGLEMARGSTGTLRTAGLACTVVVVVKAAVETLTGTTLFGETTLGSSGIAIAHCHGGGVAGGLLAYAFAQRIDKLRRQNRFTARTTAS